MKGHLAELEEKKKRLAIAMRGNCERVGMLVNPLISDLAEMRIAEAAQLMDEIVVQQAELLNVSAKIASISAELYG